MLLHTSMSDTDWCTFLINKKKGEAKCHTDAGVIFDVLMLHSNSDLVCSVFSQNL